MVAPLEPPALVALRRLRAGRGGALPAGESPQRALLAVLFERCMAARGRPATGAVAVAPAVRAAIAAEVAVVTAGGATWSGRTLGAIYERLLDPATRRAGGIYYTPDEPIACILTATLDPLLAACATAADPPAAIRAIRVLDPACGAGYFLAAAAGRIAAALAAALGSAGGTAAACWTTALSCLYGVDRDPVALDLTRYTLALAGGQDGAAHLHDGDALADLPPGWADFDGVVGNPPYVAQRAQAAADKAGRAARYQTARGQYDLSVLFIERGLSLLRPGGVLGYLLPNGFMAADYGEPVRELLARRSSLLRLEDRSRSLTFPGAAAYPVILVARNTPPAADHRIVVRGPGGSEARLAQRDFCGLDATILPAAATPAGLALARRIATQPSRLPGAAIRCGVTQAGAAGTAISATDYAALTDEAQADYLPLLQTQGIAPYRLRQVAKPRYLHRSAITPGQWRAFLRPSVVVPGVARRLAAAPCGGGQALGRVYAIADGATAYPPGALLALLNSRLLAWYYRFLYWPVHLSGGYLRVNSTYLARLPLPPPQAIPPVISEQAALMGALDGAAAQEMTTWLDEQICALYGVDLAELTAAELTLTALTSDARA